MRDYYIKDEESKEYLDIINSLKINKIPLVWYVSDIKKMYIGKLYLFHPGKTL